jgi:hypothetical protein
LRSFCNSQWNFALALVARALQIPKQVLIRFPVAVSEEILGLGVLSALVDCSGEAGADFHRAGFVLLAIGCSKEAVGCDEENKTGIFSTSFYTIACVPRHQILPCSWQIDFGQGFSLAIRGLGFTIVTANFSACRVRIPPSRSFFLMARKKGCTPNRDFLRKDFYV